jgi:hypothetical protein
VAPGSGTAGGRADRVDGTFAGSSCPVRGVLTGKQVRSGSTRGLGYSLRVKRGPRRIKAEHDDAARVAGLLHLPVREVATLAEEAAYRMFHSEPTGSTAGRGGRDGGRPGPGGAAS